MSLREAVYDSLRIWSLESEFGAQFELFADHRISVTFDDLDEIRIALFKLKQHPNSILELHLTSYKDDQQQHTGHPPQILYVSIAPYVRFEDGSREAFRAIVITTQTEEMSAEIAHLLDTPVNRLLNVHHLLIKVLDIDIIRQRLLATLSPTEVGRLEQVSKACRDKLLSDKVDREFWKDKWHQLASGSGNNAEGLTYRQRYFEAMNQRRAMQMNIPFQRVFRANEPTSTAFPVLPRSDDPMRPPRVPAFAQPSPNLDQPTPFSRPLIHPDPSRPGRRPQGPEGDPPEVLPNYYPPGRGGGRGGGFGGGGFGTGGSGGWGGGGWGGGGIV